MATRHPIVLTYHQISDLDDQLDPYRISVSPADFDRQMRHLKEQRYNVISIDALVSALESGTSLPPNSVVITFDDGYLDNYTNAWEILQRYDFPATIFLVSGLMGKAALWDGEIGAQLPLMSVMQAREMQADGKITFGSHTHTHAALDRLPIDEVRAQLNTSKAVLEDALGKAVTMFAYPYERFNIPVQNAVVDAGYSAAFGAEHMSETLLNIWRVEIGRAEQDFSRFERKLSAWWKPLTQTKQLLRPLVHQIKKGTGNLRRSAAAAGDD